jgi:hypothetical protein
MTARIFQQSAFSEAVLMAEIKNDIPRRNSAMMPLSIVIGVVLNDAVMPPDAHCKERRRRRQAAPTSFTGAEY